MSTVLERLNGALTGRYTVERELGEGGMATVYLAQDVKHRRRVALKVLKPELSAVVGAERFLAEIETTANLQQPHILPLYDSGEADGFLFYVMPYVEGETLRERIDREKQLPVDEAVSIATAVANALDYAHRQGVIHRDIKPANILMQDGQPVVADFGIALAVGAAGGSRLTETGLSVGTPFYMSPEQATGDQQVGPASDTYGLAAVLYEMLTGDPPYIASTAQAVLGKIIQGAPVSATEVRKSIPANVDAAIRKGLEKLPADRFKNAQELARALADSSFRHGEAVRAGAEVAQRARAATALAGWGVAAAVAVALGWSLLRPAPPQPVSRYAVDLGLVPVTRVGSGQTTVTVSPDGGTFVFVGGSGREQQLYVRPRDRLEATPLPGTSGALNPSFSPDGARVAFVTTSGGRRLMSVGAAGGPPLMVEDSLVDLGGVSWGYDGFIYYDGHLEGDGVARVAEGGGAPAPVTMPNTAEGEAWHSAPHALPNGRGVLFQSRRGSEFDVAVVDLETGAHKILIRGGSAPTYAASGHLLYVTMEGALVAAPFDQDRMTVTGESVALVDGLALGPLGAGQVEVARDGTLVYLTGAARTGGTMVWVDRSGSAIPVDPEWQAGDYAVPALSPDGSELAFAYTRGDETEVWIKRVAGGPPRQLTFGGDRGAPGWSPDGRSLVYSGSRADRPGLYRMPSDGSEAETLLYDGVNVFGGAYAPHGGWIVYVEAVDLYAWRLDGDGALVGEPVPLVQSPTIEVQPTVSPDGRWLAYVSDRSGVFEVYVSPFPDVGEVRYLVSTGGGRSPVWARDGSELFYWSDAEQLVSVEVVPGPTFVSGAVRELFSVADMRRSGLGGSTLFDVTPDRSRFVMVQLPEGGEASRLIVVENFFEELKARVPPR